jgi:hypothetical protein
VSLSHNDILSKKSELIFILFTNLLNIFMPKYFREILTIFIFSFIFSFFTPISVGAQSASTSMTVSQLVEMLITIGVISPDKAVAARATAITFDQTGIATTTPAVAVSTPYIQVLSPNGAESWEIDLDVPYTITWGSTGLAHVDVALVSSNTKIPLCNLTSAPITTKDGNNSFKILLKTAMCTNSTTGSSTPLIDGSYKVRVYGTDNFGTTAKDESNAVFKIIPKPIPSLKVTYPNGTETLIRNNEYVVKYTAKNVDETDDNLIYLYILDNTDNVVSNSRKLFRRDGTYNLDLPSSLKVGAYKIKLKLTTDERVELEDMSDNFFWITTRL